jgi:hypothetical protein
MASLIGIRSPQLGQLTFSRADEENVPKKLVQLRGLAYLNPRFHEPRAQISAPIGATPATFS